MRSPASSEKSSVRPIEFRDLPKGSKCDLIGIALGMSESGLNGLKTGYMKDWNFDSFDGAQLGNEQDRESKWFNIMARIFVKKVENDLGVIVPRFDSASGARLSNEQRLDEAWDIKREQIVKG
jgi:hypothetical protein